LDISNLKKIEKYYKDKKRGNRKATTKIVPPQ
jgi:hypothetical protein